MIKGLEDYIDRQTFEPMTVLAVRVPKTMISELKRIAKGSPLKHTDVIRAAIEKVISENPPKKKQVSEQKRIVVQMPMFDDFL